MIKIKVAFGKPDAVAMSRGVPYSSTTKGFATEEEAISYLQGLSDACGYMEVGVIANTILPLPDSIDDLYYRGIENDGSF